jgi:hypothetical protein
MLVVITVTSLQAASAGFLLGLLFNSKDGGNMFLRNVGLSPNYEALQPRRPYHGAVTLTTTAYFRVAILFTGMLVVITVTSLQAGSAGFLLGLLFNAEDGGDMFLRNVGLSPNYKALQPRRPYFSLSESIFIIFFTSMYRVIVPPNNF